MWQISTRLAGHAKWQNIAATKGANDKKFSRICSRQCTFEQSNGVDTNPNFYYPS